MENLYIKISETGEAIEHPLTEENLRYIYPDISPENIPQGYALFYKTGMPEIEPFKVFVGTEYVKVYNYFEERWIVRDMTEEERNTLIDQIKQNKPFESWLWSDELSCWLPPIPRPEDGLQYRWNEETTSWKILNDNTTQ